MDVHPNPVKAAAIYCRISDDREGAGLGVTRQRQDCEQLADRRGWPVADVITDNDLSAYSGRPRPGYTALLDGLRAGRYDAVIAWHPDRLHRSPRELEDFMDVIERHGVAVATVTAGDIDLSTPSGRMVARMLGAAARHESEHKSARIRRKHEELAASGRSIHGSRRPFGYRKGGLEVDPAEAAEVRDAARRLLAGEPLVGIVRDWRDRVPTVDGGTWSQYGIKRLLTSGRVAGMRTHRGALAAEGEWPAILDRATWERLRALLLNPARWNTARQPRRYVLRGLAVCGRCGHGLIGRPRGGKRPGGVYVCPPTGDGGCGGVGAVADQLEGCVAEVVFAAVAGEGLAAALDRVAGGDTDLAAVAAQLQADTERLDRLAVEHFADALMTRSAYLEAKARIEARIVEAKQTLARGSEGRIPDDLPSTVEGLRGWWAAADVARRRALLDLVLERVVLLPARWGANRFEPDRVEFSWRH